MGFTTRTVSTASYSPTSATNDEEYLEFTYNTNPGPTLDLDVAATGGWSVGDVLTGMCNTGFYNLTIDPDTSVTINGSTASITVRDEQQFTLVYLGSDNWSGSVYRDRTGGLFNLGALHRQTYYVNGAGSSESLSIGSYSHFHLILDVNLDTLTFGGSAGLGEMAEFTLVLEQDATGGNTTTFPTSVDWAGASAPTQSTGGSELDIYRFQSWDLATRWHGQQISKDSS